MQCGCCLGSLFAFPILCYLPVYFSRFSAYHCANLSTLPGYSNGCFPLVSRESDTQSSGLFGLFPYSLFPSAFSLLWFMFAPLGVFMYILFIPFPLLFMLFSLLYRTHLFPIFHIRIFFSSPCVPPSRLFYSVYSFLSSDHILKLISW